MKSSDTSKEEFADVSQNIRHYHTIFFAHLTVFVTLTAGFFALVFNSNPSLTEWVKIASKVVVLIFCIVFWTNSEIYLYRLRHLRHRANELEGSLGYKQYSTLIEIAKPKLQPGTWGWRLLYFSVTIFWIASIFWA